ITLDNPPGLGASAPVVEKHITVTGDVSYEYYLGGEFGPPPENWIHFVDYVEVSAGSVVQRAVKNGSTWSRWEAHLTRSDDAAAKGITESVARVYADNLMAQSRPHSWFVYTLYPYPENELEILRPYLPPDLRQQVPNMIAALQGVTNEGLPWGLDSLHDK